MAAIEEGRVVIFKRGKYAGEKGVIVKVIDDTFVEVEIDKKKKKVNIMHLEPTPEKAK